MDTDPYTSDLDPDFVLRMAKLGFQAVADPDGNAASRALGEKLADIRQTRGLTRADLAIASGVGDQKIYLLELGYLPDDELSFQQVEALASALDLSIEELTADTPYARSTPSLIAAATQHAKTLTGKLLGRVTRGVSGWTWQFPPQPALIPASPESGEEIDEVEPIVELDEDRGQLVVQALPRSAGGLLLLRDRDSDDVILTVQLDENGQGVLTLPETGRRFAVELIEPRLGEAKAHDRDWHRIIRQWGLGLLQQVQGVWEWSPRPAPALIPVSTRGGKRNQTQGPQVEVVEDEALLRVDAGRSLAGETVVLLQLRHDRSGYDPVDEAVLDVDGHGELNLPDGDLRLALAVLPSDDGAQQVPPPANTRCHKIQRD